MRYQILAIGNIKRGFYKEGCLFYLKRLQQLAKTELIELKESKASLAEERRETESRLLLQSASYPSVCLDETGTHYSSESFARYLTNLETRGTSGLSLLIGGPEGHSKTLLTQSQGSWSLSSLTLPHELARLVLLEQLYRAETIRAGHPYHRA